MFSRATIMDFMYLLRDLNSHAELSTYAFRYELDKIAVGNNKDERVLAIGKFLLENPKTPGILGDNLTYEIVEDVISKTISNNYHFDTDNNEFINYPQLRRLLLKDGFVIVDGKLTRTFDTDINFNTNETLLGKLLDEHNLEIAKGHYSQATNAFNRGDWAACNSQLRSYVEELLNKLAEKIVGQPFSSSQMAKVELSKVDPPIFYKELNEWLDNGQGFFETFWKRLHPEGSHPGLSNEDDSIFRLNLVQISTLEILKRYDRNYS
ncbi:hypothetical protein [Sporosarcina ureae]|uniref:hypothetical protein n=1 Tax=Sporosarcina ureae TaxID=1571 RepID=UPI000A17A8D0|nr:hypothetical protein [Sporosarcina ureae]ARK21881.1 hypothetical protein SporoP32a_10305 [Sporosarcina ureae]